MILRIGNYFITQEKYIDRIIFCEIQKDLEGDDMLSCVVEIVENTFITNFFYKNEAKLMIKLLTEYSLVVNTRNIKEAAI